MEQRLLKPCHGFSHLGRRYVINSEEMTAFGTDDETAEAIEKIADAPDLELEPGVKERLRILGILSEVRAKAPDAAQADEPLPIANMSLFLTQSCNLRCVYCYGEGGEYGTGGSMDEKIAFLKEFDITFMVSFDGTRELQDRQRPFADGKGSYDSALPGIKKLLAAMPQTRGHAILVGETDPKAVRDALMEIGFQHISISFASRSLFAERPDKEKQAERTGHVIGLMEAEAERWVTCIKNRDTDALKAIKACSDLYYGIMFLLHNARRYHACGAGRGFVAVAYSGDVYLCHRFVGREEYRLGSIFERELKREPYQKSPVIGNHARCTACFARYYCAGGCKHDNAGSCGSIWKPPADMCAMKRREFELLASVSSRLDSGDRAFLVEEEIFPPKPCLFDF